MIRLAISVEGETEEAFVKNVLANHLNPLGIYPTGILIRGRGGNVSVERLVPVMVNFTWEFDAVTSLVDFYGFRNKGERSVDELEAHLLCEINKKNLGPGRVFPYVQKHEFEGLLFSDTSAFGVIADLDERNIIALSNIRGQFDSPEHINDGPESAPSKRILHTVKKYDKVRYGWEIAQKAGLDKIRRECQRFHDWLTRLEGLAS